MNKNYLVSVIIPCYNSEKYILDLLNDLVNQTYKNIEILVIDDGSEDNTKIVVENYMRKYNYKNIKYYHKENKGVSSARNYGINISRGEFIVFVDSDDRVDLTLIEKLILEYYKTNKFVVTNAMYVKKNKKYIYELNKNSCKDNELKTAIFNKRVAKINYNFKYEFARHCAGKLYKNDIIKNNKIFFDENMYLFEDAYFTLCYLNFCDEIRLIDEPLYVYKIENGKSGIYRSNLITEDEYKINKINQYVKNQEENVRIAKKIYYFDLFSALIKNYLNSKKNDMSNIEKIKFIKDILKKNTYEDILSYKNYKYLNAKKKFLFILFKLHLYYFIIIILKNKD